MYQNVYKRDPSYRYLSKIYRLFIRKATTIVDEIGKIHMHYCILGLVS